MTLTSKKIFHLQLPIQFDEAPKQDHSGSETIVIDCVGKLIVSNYLPVSINNWLRDMLGT